MKTYALKMGKYLITDVLDPKSGQIDLDAVEERLRTMHRFSNDPAALTVHVHRVLVVLIAHALLPANHPRRLEILIWCYHHDDHESVTGDIPGPLKALIAECTSILQLVERRLDIAIAAAREGSTPCEDVKDQVHVFDKMAEAIEWRYVLDQPAADWNASFPFTEYEAEEFLSFANDVAHIDFSGEEGIEYITIPFHGKTRGI